METESVHQSNRVSSSYHHQFPRMRSVETVFTIFVLMSER